MRHFSFNDKPSITSDAFLIRSFIFVGKGPLNISCKGDVEYDVQEPHDEFVETATDGIQEGTLDDEKSIGEKLCGTSVAIYLCVLWII